MFRYIKKMTNNYVNEDYFQRLNISELVWYFSSDANTAKFAFDMLQRHQIAAALQMQRIIEAVNHLSENMPKEPAFSDQKLAEEYFGIVTKLDQSIFIEVHFYFISWVNCENMIKVLGSFPEFIEAKKYSIV